MTTTTTEYTHPEVLGRGVAEGWADVRAAAALPRSPLTEPEAPPRRYHGKQEAGTP